MDNYLHIDSPLIESLIVGNSLDAKVWLKMDTMQPSGSFKLRGIGYAALRYAEQGAEGFIAASGGNAGLAVAYAGRKLNKTVTVVVPTTTKEIAKNLIKREGAHVIVKGDNFLASHDHAITMSNDRIKYIHPFDDPLIWEGHSTLIDEIVNKGVNPDAILLSVGGGGLLLGVEKGLKRNALNHTKIIAVETEGADSFNQCIDSDEFIELKEITTVATSLGAKKVAKALFDLRKSKNILGHVVSDKDAVNAVDCFLNDHRQLVEPACGASLAPLYNNLEVFKDMKEIVVVVCGGVGFSLADLTAFKAR
tara:strand:- start:3724 stop:4644 length:921 start_codon:yes stop_codon:yes gene_type:complete